MNGYQARFNPFLFSPNTNFRFALLVLAIVGSSLFIYETLFFQTFANEYFQAIQDCIQEANRLHPGETLDEVNLANQHANRCNEKDEQRQAQWILSRFVLLLVLAVVIYLLMPIWRIWRDKLTAFSAEDDPEVMNCLTEFCQEAQLSKRPKFFLRALNPSPSGLAFGCLGRYYIVLNGGLIMQFYQSKERFKAILRHELAHLQNKDIDKTYFSLALGIAFLLAGIFPLVWGTITTLSFSNWAQVPRVIFSAGLFSLLVYIALASVLRSREMYADVRASVNEDSYKTLQNEFSTEAGSEYTSWRQLFRLHPTPALRRKVLQDTHLLSQMTYGEAFMTGILSTIGLSAIDNFLSAWLPAELESIGSTTFLVTLILTSFTTLAIGIGVWQAVFSARVLNKKISGMGRLGLIVGLGMLVGLSISFSSILLPSESGYASLAGSSTPFAVDWIPDAIANQVFEVLWRITFLVGLFFIFKWTATCASIWLETVSNQSNLRYITSLCLLLTAGLMAYWSGIAISLQKLGYLFPLFLIGLLTTLGSTFSSLEVSNATKWILNITTVLQVLSGFVFPLFILVWILPLAARLRALRTKLQSPFLAYEGTVDLPVTRYPHIHPFSTFLTGLAVGLGFLLTVALLRMFLHSFVPENDRLTQSWSLSIRLVQAYLAIFTQILLTIFISPFRKQIGWAHGLFAAFVAGCVMYAGIVGLEELGDCLSIFKLTKAYSCLNFFDSGGISLYFPILLLGTSLSFPFAFIASWIGSTLRTLWARPSPS